MPIDSSSGVWPDSSRWTMRSSSLSASSKLSLAMSTGSVIEALWNWRHPSHRAPPGQRRRKRMDRAKAAQDRIEVELCPHNPAWADMAAAQAARLKGVLGRSLLAVHHIGSTAI